MTWTPEHEARLREMVVDFNSAITSGSAASEQFRQDRESIEAALGEIERLKAERDRHLLRRRDAERHARKYPMEFAAEVGKLAEREGYLKGLRAALRLWRESWPLQMGTFGDRLQSAIKRVKP